MNEVARRYQFIATHHVPGLPEPWSIPHQHLYTVEVIARGVGSLIVDTDDMDRRWDEIRPNPFGDIAHGADLDQEYGAANTTVEALATRWLRGFRERLPMVARVVVWEDESRWGSAE
jgi:6-pyruvoyl-tetrahydropterin synthase